MYFLFREKIVRNMSKTKKETIITRKHRHIYSAQQSTTVPVEQRHRNLDGNALHRLMPAGGPAVSLDTRRAPSCLLSTIDKPVIASPLGDVTCVSPHPGNITQSGVRTSPYQADKQKSRQGGSSEIETNVSITRTSISYAQRSSSDDSPGNSLNLCTDICLLRTVVITPYHPQGRQRPPSYQKNTICRSLALAEH